MNADFTNMSSFFQPQVLPGFASVRRAVYPIPIRDVDANRGFTGTGVNYVGVTLRYRQGAYGCGIQVTIGYALPVGAAICCFPDAPGAGTEIECHWVGGVPGYGHDSSAARWTNTTPFHLLGYGIPLFLSRHWISRLLVISVDAFRHLFSFGSLSYVSQSTRNGPHVLWCTSDSG